MALIERDLERAATEMERLRQTTATAVGARYDRRIGRVVVRLSSGLEVAFPPHDAQGLETARPADLGQIEISPSGLGIHFPKLDADIYVPTLLQGLTGSRDWMARRPTHRPGKPRRDAAAQHVRSQRRCGCAIHRLHRWCRFHYEPVELLRYNQRAPHKPDCDPTAHDNVWPELSAWFCYCDEASANRSGGKRQDVGQRQLRGQTLPTADRTSGKPAACAPSRA